MQLHIRVGFDTYILEVKHFTTIDHVKVLLAIRISITPDATYQLCVSCCGKMIRDDETVGSLESYNVDITVHLPGGKVHGSLARAGKVRSQTVKVEKKEKHKPKTGRAKRRQQFNRRFAQSAAAGGHQRPQGPNSQRGK